MSDTGYSYGVPEMYSFEGEPMLFTNITEMKVVDASSENAFVEYGKSFLISGVAYLGDKKLPNASKGIAITKYEAGYRVNHSGKMVRYNDFEKFLSSQKSLRQFIPLEKKVVNGVDQLAIIQTKLPSTKTFYFLKNASNIFGSLYSLTEVAKGGKDVNSVLSDALVLASNSTPVLGILTKMTLDVLASPMKEFMADGLERDKKELDAWKFLGEKRFKIELYNSMFLRDIYKTISISYKSMQGLLKGTLKKIGDLESSYDEVTIVFKEVEDGILIDTFFINIKEK